MNYLYEEKLSTEDRNNLDDTEFGLPDERKFPLNDENHVRSAIQYFKFCKKSKRAELANNINKRLKELDMVVKVNESNPFYKYIDKSYLTESLVTNNDFETVFDKKLNSFLYELENITEINLSMEQVEDKIINFYNSIYKLYPIETLLNFVNFINDIMDRKYSEFASYCEYNQIQSNISHKTVAMYKDLFIIFYEDMEYCKEKENYNILKPLFILSSISPFKKIIYRTLIGYFLIYRIDTIKRIMDIVNNTEYIKDEETHKCIDELFESLISSFEYIPNIKLYLENKKRLNDNEIYIINQNVNGYDKKSFSIPYSQLTNQTVKTKIILLENNNIDFNRLVFNDKKYNTDLSDTDIMKLYNKNCLDNICFGHFKNDDCWYGIKDENLFYILHNTETNEIVLVNIGDDEIVKGLCTTNDMLVLDDNDIQLISNNDDNKIVSESFKINEKGDIIITINSKKSYMDKYSEIHHILKENYKLKNYDSMKTNIGYMFALINMIERDKKYKKRDSELVKARAFAINDFKTYLKYIQDNEPDFDFIKFYQKNDYDKKIINIPSTTLTGIKSIFKAIL